MRKSKCDVSAWLFELAGGAILDYEGTCIPKAQREAAFTIAALHQWEIGVDDPRCVTSAEDVRLSPSPCALLTMSHFFLSTKQWLGETIKPVACGGSFPSVSFLLIAQIKILICGGDIMMLQFFGRHEPPARVAASFGENWERLVALKKKYDPTGLFRNTFWPLDKDGREMDPSEHEPPEPEF